MRLIATDMDGTLLNSSHLISERNKQSIVSLQQRGIEVVVATGRSFPEAAIPVKQAGLTLPYICMNGAEVRDKAEQVISATHLLKEDVKQAIDILRKHNIYFDLFIDKYVFVEDVEKQIDMFIQVGKSANQHPPEELIRNAVFDRVNKGFIRQVRSYQSIISQYESHIYKILGICSNEKDFITVSRELERCSGLAISSSGQGVIEVTNINAQKGIALERYAKGLGIQMKDVMVIGDSYNDISMMERAGCSVAMENAPKEVRDICTHITLSSENDGFAEAVNKIL